LYKVEDILHEDVPPTDRVIAELVKGLETLPAVSLASLRRTGLDDSCQVGPSLASDFRFLNVPPALSEAIRRAT